MSGTVRNGACRARFSRLAADGTPVFSSATGAWMDCDIQSGQIAIDEDTATDVVEKNGCGLVRFRRRRRNQPKGVTISNLTIISNDPRQMELFLGGLAVLLGTAEAPTGFALLGPTCDVPDDDPIAIEIWSDNYLCGVPDPDFPFLRRVIPKAKLTWAGVTVDENAGKAVFNGYGEPSNTFGDGPFGDLDQLATLDQFMYAEVGDTSMPDCPTSVGYLATPSSLS